MRTLETFQDDVAEVGHTEQKQAGGSDHGNGKSVLYVGFANLAQETNPCS